MNNRTSTIRLFLAAWGLYMMYFGLSEPLSRLMIEVEGKVIDSVTECMQPQNNRCVTTYTLRPTKGFEPSLYSAGYTDKSLSRDIETGSHVEKHKWELGY